MSTNNSALIFNPSPDTLEAAGNGMTICRLPTAQRLALTPGQNGVIVYDAELFNYYQWRSGAWVVFDSGGFTGTVTSVSVTTANGVSGVVANPTTTPAISLTLGAITPQSAAFTGTAGAGFVSVLTQSIVPGAPASGFALYADSTGKFSWRRADGNTRTFEVVASTGNRIFTLPDADFTFAGQNLANTFSLAQVFSANGALSAPAVSITGTPITGGTATTTKPMVLIETAGATSTGWVTTGTMFGINTPSGFAGRPFQVLQNGLDRMWVGPDGEVSTTYLSISASSGAVRLANDTYWTRKAPANWQLGAADAAAPVAQILSFQGVSAGTNNTAGTNGTIKGSGSTGNQNGGSIIFQTTPPGGSGTAQNTQVTALTIAGDANSTVTFGGAARLATKKVGTLPAAGVAGRRYYVTDALDPAYGVAVAGGGAVSVPVFDNGVAWVSA